MSPNYQTAAFHQHPSLPGCESKMVCPCFIHTTQQAGYQGNHIANIAVSIADSLLLGSFFCRSGSRGSHISPAATATPHPSCGNRRKSSLVGSQNQIGGER